MTFEITLAVTTLIATVLAIVHAFKTRTRQEAWLLTLPAILFGYCFPYVDVNIFGHYGFDGQLTILNLPFELGFAWWVFYYTSLVVVENIWGRDCEPVKLAILTGIVFGLLEYQWDLTLVGTGLMSFHVPSFAEYPFGFHPGIPMFHALLGFNWIYAYAHLRRTEKLPQAVVASWLSIVIIPLSVMACVPLTQPMIEALGPKLPHFWQHVADTVHFSTTFAGVAFLATFWFRFLGRRLGQPSEAA